jgi:hypothetical protein
VRFTSYLTVAKSSMLFPLINWAPAIEGPPAQLIDIVEIAPGILVGIVFSNANNYYYSRDDGETWVDGSSTFLGSGSDDMGSTGAVTSPVCIACKSDNKYGADSIVLVGGQRTAGDFTIGFSNTAMVGGAASWRFAGVSRVIDGDPARIDQFIYRPQDDTWLAFGMNTGATAAYIARSVSPITVSTWVSQTIPGAFPATSAFMNAVISNSGRIVASFAYGGTVRFLYSDDGINWNLTTTALPAGNWRLGYDSKADVFMAMTNVNFYASNDGLTWTNVGVAVPPAGPTSVESTPGGYIVGASTSGLQFWAKGGTEHFSMRREHVLPGTAWTFIKIRATGNRLIRMLWNVDASNTMIERSIRLGLENGSY